MNKAVMVLFLCRLLAQSRSCFSKCPQAAAILALDEHLTDGNRGTSYPSILRKLSTHQVITAGQPGEMARTKLRPSSRFTGSVST